MTLSDCLEWTKARSTCGYGQKRLNGKLVQVHRLALCQAWGIPLALIQGLDVLHTCDNPTCFNPRHLRLGTRADNNRDRADKGRSARSVPSRRKVAQEQAETIRRSDASVSSLARDYCVDRKTIRNILTRRTHV